MLLYIAALQPMETERNHFPLECLPNNGRRLKRLMQVDSGATYPRFLTYELSHAVDIVMA